MKRFVFMVCLVLGIVFLMSSTACRDDSDYTIQNQQKEQLLQANQKLGLPAITRFQEKETLKMIYELRDRADLITYVYLFPEMTGKLIFIGKAVGYGIPYATQYSNPEKIINPASSYATMPQAEPNGLFMPSSAEGTWVLLIGPDGKPHPVYIEPRVVISPFKLEI